MAARRKAATAVSPPGKTRATATADEEPDYTVYADKAMTAKQAAFRDWILEKVDIDPTAYKTKAEAFDEGVRLGASLRMRFQASPENQELLAEERAAREAEKAKPKAKAKRGRRAEEPEEPEEPDDELEEPEVDEEEPEPEPEPEPKPRRGARRASTTATRKGTRATAAKTTAAKSGAAKGGATRRTSRRAATASGDSAAAPF